MKRRSVLRIAVAVILCAATSAPAGIRDRAFELGAYGGITSGDNNANISSDFSYGVRGAYAFSRKLMVEANLDVFDTDVELEGRAGDRNLPASQVPYTHETPTSFFSYSVGLTANFLTDKETRTIPYLSVGIGAVQEERTGATFCVDLAKTDNTECSDVRPNGSLVDPGSGADPNAVAWISSIDEKDTGTLLTFAVGARTFLTSWFGIRYEGRWYHHDTFDMNQDAFQATVGATFVLGGKK